MRIYLVSLLMLFFITGCSSGSGSYRVSNSANLSNYKYAVISEHEIREFAGFAELQYEDALYSMGMKVISNKDAVHKNEGTVFILKSTIEVRYSAAGLKYHYDATVNFKDFHSGRTLLIAQGSSGSDMFDRSWSSELAIQRAMDNAKKAFVH